MTAFVEVTSDDFNGSTWDGAPFRGSGDLDWLKSAVTDGRIRVHGDDLDYAIWDVRTPNGIVRALPDDRIEYANGVLSVVERQEKYRHPSRLPL